MNISFFEIQPWERQEIEKALSDHQLHFSDQPLTANNIDLALQSEIISVFVHSDLNAYLLASLPELKLILTRSTGFDHIDLEACGRNQVTVCNVPNYGERTVAEFTIALIFSLSRKITQITWQPGQTWPSSQKSRGIDLKGKKLGIVGTGKIGLQVAKLANALGMEILAYDIYPNQAAAEQIGFQYLFSLEELLPQVDFVSLHAPLTKDNYHILGQKNLSFLSQDAYLINTSRGGLVDSRALCQALKQNLIAGAALDVLEEEDQLPAEEIPGYLTELLQHPALLYTPHLAYNSQEAVGRILSTTLDNLQAFLAGQTTNMV